MLVLRQVVVNWRPRVAARSCAKGGGDGTPLVETAGNQFRGWKGGPRGGGPTRGGPTASGLTVAYGVWDRSEAEHRRH
ncbi:hypothetical protein GWI33_000449 [Rhynchophorus ferrugineus]|uniref:Uncharacterized protein n=1 Tax=Rhynchophorus ferrugineus TaxID=354439 RepID=A0A834HN64_RHYFE|nr:hypothetical protein GWI33_000451 [Rhynchophorus ferrugineus]KAF7264229.1 hypothetical protein GWI33_000449 [Rhynchophorus ferrugineus]